MKRHRVLEFLESNNLDGILLTQQSNIAWYTDGARSHINIASEESIAELLITKTAEHLFVNAIENRRFIEEELLWKPEQVHINAWWDDAGRRKAIKKQFGNRIDTDSGALKQEVARLRYSLLPSEITRYRVLGKEVAEAFWEVSRVLRQGMTEYDLAAELSLRLTRRGIDPLVNLVAFDERVKAYRHPLPTSKLFKKVALMVICGRRSGLIASASRQLVLGGVSDEFRKKHAAVATLDAWLLQQTIPQIRVADIFHGLQEQYALVGYPNEWYLHHQGGATGYSTRDYRATEQSKEIIQPNQAFAWNPTITGTKSEDTIIANERGYEVLTYDPRWPSAEVDLDGKSVKRPDLLILE